MIDIDFFKLFNDTYGHLEGDQCLSRVAQLVSSVMKRPKDAVIRFGGEEFLVILPYIDSAGASLLAQELVEIVQKAEIPHAHGIGNKVSISVGYTVWQANKVAEEGVEALIEEADVKLFEAKEQGRNQVRG